MSLNTLEIITINNNDRKERLIYNVNTILTSATALEASLTLHELKYPLPPCPTVNPREM